MTNVGKTLLKGHTLRGEGYDRWDDEGRFLTYQRLAGRARCSCGEMSEPGLSIAAAKRWHREHKDSLR